MSHGAPSTSGRFPSAGGGLRRAQWVQPRCQLQCARGLPSRPAKTAKSPGVVMPEPFFPPDAPEICGAIA